MTTAQIQNMHCERIAFVYVRQSTPLQVIEHRESTERTVSSARPCHRTGLAAESRGGHQRGPGPLRQHRSTSHRISAPGIGSGIG